MVVGNRTAFGKSKTWEISIIYSSYIFNGKFCTCYINAVVYKLNPYKTLRPIIILPPRTQSKLLNTPNEPSASPSLSTAPA